MISNLILPSSSVLADSVYDFISSSKTFNDVNRSIDIDMDFWLNIKTFLIDGYLAFEIISKDGQILSLSPLYPSTITFDGATFKQDDKIFTKDQIIYLMYSKVADSHCSCVEELKESYEKMKMAESKVFYIDTVHH